MTRQEIIENTTIELVGQKLKDAVKRITEFYKNNQDEVEEKIFQEITYGLQQCVQTKKKLGYIAISVLESSIITKTYDLQIAFYNKDLYADGYPVYKYWAPAFIYESLDADIEEIEKALDYMEQSICSKIRKVDVCTRYSSMQYLIILFEPQENQIPNVMERIFMHYYELCDSNDFKPQYEYIRMTDDK